MTRIEFMAELRNLLLDINEAEREAAINYYEDYFDDAGAENEASVVESLGTPKNVATNIKNGLNDSNGFTAEYTENGYSSGTGYDRGEVIAANAGNDDRDFEKGKGLQKGARVAIWGLLLFALIVLVPPVVATLFGILCAVAGILLAVLLSGIAIVIAGVVTIVIGVLTLFTTPSVGALLVGGGLVILGVGILFAVLGIWILAKIIPTLVGGFVTLLNKIFKRKRG